MMRISYAHSFKAFQALSGKRPATPAGALAGRADQPRYRSERDPAERPDAPRQPKGQRGPTAGNAAHREGG